jgi:hypothetical protein
LRFHRRKALEAAGIGKRMRICGTKCNNLEDELFQWFCHA